MSVSNISGSNSSPFGLFVWETVLSKSKTLPCGVSRIREVSKLHDRKLPETKEMWVFIDDRMREFADLKLPTYGHNPTARSEGKFDA